MENSITKCKKKNWKGKMCVRNMLETAGRQGS